jgi:hypothetical protein
MKGDIYDNNNEVCHCINADSGRDIRNHRDSQVDCGEVVLMIKLKTDKTAQTEKFSYKYMSLERLLDVLDQNGINIIQYTDTDPHNLQDYIWTVVVRDGQKEEALRGERVTYVDDDKNPVQAGGKAYTYARRRSIFMTLGIQPEDEDDDAQGIERSGFTEKKATEKQISLLKKYYTGENQQMLFDFNGWSKWEDIPISKASELISKIKGGDK